MSDTTHSNTTSVASGPARLGRRTFFTSLTYLMSAAAALVCALPFVGYLLGPARKREVEWIDLGPVAKFPPQETRLETFVNKLKKPWDGMAANTAVYVRNRGKDLDPSDKA